MEYIKKYVIENKPLKNILDDIQEFNNLIDKFKEKHQFYEYDIKIIKDGDVFNGVITIINEK